MIKPKRRLKDLIIDLIALVKSPATGIRFAVIKSVKGGDDLMDKIFELIREIYGDDSLQAFEKSAIPESSVEAIKSALTDLKAVVSDLPENVQTAIKLLTKIAGYGHTPAVKSAEKPKKDEKSANEFAGILTELTEKFSTVNDQFTSAMSDVQKSSDKSKEQLKSLQTTLVTLTDRMKALETATGAPVSKGAEDVHIKKDEKPKEDADVDIWVDKVPGQVML